jgi:hypothetical protein
MIFASRKLFFEIRGKVMGGVWDYQYNEMANPCQMVGKPLPDWMLLKNQGFLYIPLSSDCSYVGKSVGRFIGTDNPTNIFRNNQTNESMTEYRIVSTNEKSNILKDVGTMDCWDIGMSGYWKKVTLEHWNVGTLER